MGLGKCLTCWWNTIWPISTYSVSRSLVYLNISSQFDGYSCIRSNIHFFSIRVSNCTCHVDGAVLRWCTKWTCVERWLYTSTWCLQDRTMMICPTVRSSSCPHLSTYDYHAEFPALFWVDLCFICSFSYLVLWCPVMLYTLAIQYNHVRNPFEQFFISPHFSSPC